MTSMYGSNMTIGLPYEASGETGPLPTTRRSNEHRYGRFHPYTGYSSGCHRNVYEANSSAALNSGFSADNFFRAALPANYFANCQFPGAGALLASALHRQEYPTFNTEYQLTSFPQMFTLKSLQNLCDPAANNESKFSDTSSNVHKDRNHPFYLRKRAEPAEGMTRTRDKYRVVYTEKQRKGLEDEYKTNMFITTERKAEISRELDLSERQIKIWFQNRRAKERRDIRKKKDIEQMDSENSFEDDTDNGSHSPINLDNATFPTSYRFEEKYAQPIEKTFSSGQCLYTSQVQLGCTKESIFSNSYFPESRDSEIARNPMSPTEFGTAMENSFIPALDVSPIMGNLNNDCSLRL